MIRRPPIPTRTHTLFSCPTLFRSGGSAFEQILRCCVEFSLTRFYCKRRGISFASRCTHAQLVIARTCCLTFNRGRMLTHSSVKLICSFAERHLLSGGCRRHDCGNWVVGGLCGTFDHAKRTVKGCCRLDLLDGVFELVLLLFDLSDNSSDAAWIIDDARRRKERRTRPDLREKIGRAHV